MTPVDCASVLTNHLQTADDVNTIGGVRYTYDPKKLAINVANHQVWFHEAEGFAWETAVVSVDGRRHYGETRFVAHGLIEDRLYVMVFTLRETSVRVISLRKANSREVKRYACND